MLADRLSRAGIEMTGKIVIDADNAAAKGLSVIATEETGIGQVLARMNKRSLNMMAECLFLRSAVRGREPATWASAAKTARAVLTTHYGLDGEQLVVSDGSGLSKRNRVSPAALTSLLRSLASEDKFVRSLPISGADGSLRRRLRDAVCRNRILGKTGSLNRASALSGYILDAGGKPAMAFSILINGSKRGAGYSARSLQESICRVLVRALDASAATTKPKQKSK